MQRNSTIWPQLLVWAIALSACSSFWPTGPGIDQPVQTRNNKWEILVRDSYQGTKLGNLQDISLENGYGFITLELCIRNLSSDAQVVHWEDISMITEDGTIVFPMGQGYRQSEVFGWLVAVLKPFGAKRVVDDLWYTRIQNYELVSLPAHQSQGCKDSYQLKTYAHLYMVRQEMLEKPFTLRFVEEEITLTAREPFVVSRQTIQLLKQLGVLFLFLLTILVQTRNRRLRREKAQKLMEATTDKS